MNIDYLYSIINLYLKKENDHKKTSLNINKIDDKVEFNFNMNDIDSDKTSFVIPFDEFYNHLDGFVEKYKENIMIIDERYNSDKVNGTCYYYVLFKNGRRISFNGFSMFEMNDIRNALYDIKINKEEVRVNDIEEEKQMPYEPRLRLQQSGFSSVASIVLAIIFFADVLVITLWVLKLIFK